MGTSFIDVDLEFIHNALHFPSDVKIDSIFDSEKHGCVCMLISGKNIPNSGGCVVEYQKAVDGTITCTFKAIPDKIGGCQ